MADTTITITDGSVTKSIVIAQATWNEVIKDVKRQDPALTLANTTAEYVHMINQLGARYQRHANREIEASAAVAATKVAISAVS